MRVQPHHHIANQRRWFWIASLSLFGVFCLTMIRAKDQIVGLPELHFWIESALAAFSGGVAWLCLRGYLTSGSMRLLMLALAFYVSGLIDLLADLIAPGGYQVAVFAEDGDLSMWLWCISRLVGAVFLFLSIAGPRSREGRNSSARYIQVSIWAIASTLFSLGLALGLDALHLSLPLVWTKAGGRLTDIGVGFVLVSALIMALATRAYLRRYNDMRNPTLLAFSIGIVALICSALVPLVSNIFYGVFFWYGDLYQIIGFLAFGYGIMLLRRSDRVQSEDE